MMMFKRDSDRDTQRWWQGVKHYGLIRDPVRGLHPLPGWRCEAMPGGRASGQMLRVNRPLSLIAVQSTAGQRNT